MIDDSYEVAVLMADRMIHEDFDDEYDDFGVSEEDEDFEEDEDEYDDEDEDEEDY